MKPQTTSAVAEHHDRKMQLISFPDKAIYVGVDVHEKRWQTAVYFQWVVMSNTSMDAISDKL